jgi:thymidine phosphorylase
LFRAVADAIELHVEVIATETHGPIGRGIGPRLEALDVRAVLRRDADAPVDLREKSLYLAARLLEMTGVATAAGGYRVAQEALDSGTAEAAFERIVAAQGPRALPDAAPFRRVIASPADGRLREIDCWEIARVAKCAGAPANAAAGVRLLCTVGDVLTQGEPLFEVHAQSEAQLEFACAYAKDRSGIVEFGF